MTITLKPFVRRILLSSSCPIPSYDPAPNPAGVPPGRPATTRFRTDHPFVTRRPAGVPLRQAGPSRCTLVPKTASRGRSSLGRPRSARRATLPDPHLLCRRTSRFTGGHLRRGSCPARGVPRVRNTLEPLVRADHVSVRSMSLWPLIISTMMSKRFFPWLFCASYNSDCTRGLCDGWHRCRFSISHRAVSP